MSQVATPDAVLTFWFGGHSPDHASSPQQIGRWFNGGDGFDEEIRTRFGHTVDIALAGGLDHWQQSPAEQLALILVCDQFTRNIYRGSERAFAGDPLALSTSQAMIRDNLQTGFGLDQRAFLGMPLEHSELPEVQAQSVTYFSQLQQDFSEDQGVSSADAKRARSYYGFAVSHRDVIERFGRFPHRNAALARDSSGEEQEWLDNGGGF
ncbi:MULTISPECIES: DUF924 family protein [Microbulbifer]|uniref:DUF924 family protein n=1 Tax=Microbulbifer celer TaxID=435905 RepID=A0ABW3U7T6_9GAMM|nr:MULTISPECIES: DUF924 family protein [Microbulbifer]UFN58623.1 DUF924 domain-containing protein [Microbulbifer celer]